MNQRVHRRWRFGIVAAMLLAPWLGIIGHLGVLQLRDGTQYRALAHERLRTPRGGIEGRHKILAWAPTRKSGIPIALAESQVRYHIVLQPSRVLFPTRVFLALQSVNPSIDAATFDEWMASGVPRRVGTVTRSTWHVLLRQFGALEGLMLQREGIRRYPFGSTSAHLLGFVGYDDQGRRRGQYGIERALDAQLSATSSLPSSTAWLSYLLWGATAHHATEFPVGDVQLSLELAPQQLLEQTLDAVVRRWRPQEAGGVIVDPHSGRILAMAARPTFDPGRYNQYELHVFPNPLTERTYEFGSVMKPITVAMGLATGVITPTSTYLDTGHASYDGATIANYDGRARGEVDVPTILKQSLNVGAAWIAARIGTQRFLSYITRMFPGTSGIEVREVPGNFDNVRRGVAAGRVIEVATASFGQGFRVTAMEMVRALAALANGGLLPSLTVVEGVWRADGSFVPHHPPPPQRVLPAAAATEVTRMLVAVADEVMGGGKFRNPHYTSAAKTGTAQIPRVDGGGYRDDAYLHSFFVYAPAFAPRFLIFLYQVAPQGARYASETLAEPAMQLRDALLALDPPPPDRRLSISRSNESMVGSR